jgi:hypothetical protein
MTQVCGSAKTTKTSWTVRFLRVVSEVFLNYAHEFGQRNDRVGVGQCKAKGDVGRHR